jgi:hypothetical protein
MGFISSIWLFAAAAIGIPILIHLWNIKPGKTLKVGSIKLIEVSSRKSSRSFKLLDILLLLLRCLLLVLIALVLAMPYIQKGLIKNNIRGWLLIPKENFKEAYKNFKPKTDSLLNAGYELHYFNNGFKKATIQEALADTAASTEKNKTPYWSLLQQLEGLVPANLSVCLITDGLLHNFEGARPKTPLNINWLTYKQADSTDTWIQKAWFTADKNVRAIIGNGKPSGTYFNAININPNADKNQPYYVRVNNGEATLYENDNKHESVLIDTNSLSIDIYADEKSSDEKYIKSALQAVSQFTKYPINIKPFIENAHSTAKRNWLFWLSDRSIPQHVISNYQHILIYDNGKATATKSWINFSGLYSLSLGQQPIGLYKTISAKTHPAEVIWRDGFGKPLLALNHNGNTELYHFYTRFNPTWNDLVWSADFPQIILKLITDDGFIFDKTKHNRSIIAKEQLKPVFVSEFKTLNRVYKENADISRFFWLMMVLVFLAERWLANKKRLSKQD